MKKISELTLDELESLKNDYYNSELTVKQVIEKHNIDSHPSSISKELPLEDTNELCPYCNIPLKTKAKNRTDYRSNFSRGYTYICTECEHKSNTIYKCKCDNCKNKIVEEEKFEFKVNEDFLLGVVKYQKEKEYYLEDMDLKDKLIYLTFLKYLISDDKKTFIPVGDLLDIPFSPTQSYSFDLINYILNDVIRFAEQCHNVGLVFPKEEKENHQKYTYYPYKCKFTSNLELLSDNWIIEGINHCSDFNVSENSVEEAIILWKEIAFNELLEYLYSLLQKYNLDSSGEYVGDAIKESVKSILEDFSVSQGYSIIWYIVEKISAKKQEIEMSRRHAVNMIPSYIASHLSKRISGEWQTKSYKRNYNILQSAISLTYFNDILKIGEKGFTEKPSINVLRQYYTFEEETNREILVEEVKELYSDIENIFFELEGNFNPEMYEIVSAKDDEHTKAVKISNLFTKTIEDFLIEYHKMKVGKKY